MDGFYLVNGNELGSMALDGSMVVKAAQIQASNSHVLNALLQWSGSYCLRCPPGATCSTDCSSVAENCSICSSNLCTKCKAGHILVSITTSTHMMLPLTFVCLPRRRFNTPLLQTTEGTCAVKCPDPHCNQCSGSFLSCSQCKPGYVLVSPEPGRCATLACMCTCLHGTCTCPCRQPICQAARV